MNLAFEAATISVAIGAILSVLLQGRVLDREDAQRVPERVAFVLRVVDVWLAVIFILVVALVIAVDLDAMARAKPLKMPDRRSVEHLLALAAVYPLLIALSRRTLPILFAPAETPHATQQVAITVLMVPLIGLLAAVSLLPGLTDPDVALSTQLLRITLAGLVAIGPSIAAPSLARWWTRRVMRNVRERARVSRLQEQTLIATVPHVAHEIVVRAYGGYIDGHWACWLEVREVERLVRCVADARRAAHNSGADVDDVERWYWRPWPWRRQLSVRHFGRHRNPREVWSCPVGEPFVDGTGLLASLSAPMPLSRG